MTPGFAANYLTGTMVSLLAALAGPGLSAALPPHKVLAAYALLSMALCLISALRRGISACWP